MRLILFTFLCACLAERTYSHVIGDPFAGLENFAAKVSAGANKFTQGIKDQLDPMTQTIRKANWKVFGDVNKGFFNVEKGIIEGLDEVVGVPVNLDDVIFYLATSKNVNNPTKIDFYKPDDVADTSGKIFFIIHGWMSSMNNSWYQDLTEIFLRKYPDSHVVLLDWKKPSADNYPFAAFKTESVGNLVGNLIRRLVVEYHVPRTNFVLIGHSLGGQISGWAGKKFQQLTGEKLPIIVALDPAGPLFVSRPNNRRLNKYDAEVVIVIHSDAGKLGFPYPCGTIDFFPNGGAHQPGCAKVNVMDVNTILNPVSCSHLRAYTLFAEAVNYTGAFPAKRCESYTFFRSNQQCDDAVAHMGDLEVQATGSFYLDTASSNPFSIPIKGLLNIRDDIRGEVSRIENKLTGRNYQNSGDVVINVQEGGIKTVYADQNIPAQNNFGATKISSNVIIEPQNHEASERVVQHIQVKPAGE